MTRNEAFRRLVASSPKLARHAEQSALVGQAARGLAAALKQGDGTVILRLDPRHLGTLKVHVTIEDATISARIEPSNNSARELLVQSSESLRAALEARGLSVERIEVLEATGTSQLLSDRKPAPEAQAARDHSESGLNDGQDARMSDSSGGGAHAEAGAGQGGDGRTDASVTDSDDGSWFEVGDPGGAVVSLGFDAAQMYRLRLDALA